MPKTEIEKPQPTLTICPYWRRFVAYGNYTLALCGKTREDELPLSLGEGIRLQKCLWFDPDEAFDPPAIVEVDNLDVLGEPEIIERAQAAGKEGVEELEEKWDQAVKEFINYYSKGEDTVSFCENKPVQTIKPPRVRVLLSKIFGRLFNR